MLAGPVFRAGTLGRAVEVGRNTKRINRIRGVAGSLGKGGCIYRCAQSVSKEARCRWVMKGGDGDDDGDGNGMKNEDEEEKKREGQVNVDVEVDEDRDGKEEE